MSELIWNASGDKTVANTFATSLGGAVYGVKLHTFKRSHGYYGYITVTLHESNGLGMHDIPIYNTFSASYALLITELMSNLPIALNRYGFKLVEE